MTVLLYHIKSYEAHEELFSDVLIGTTKIRDCSNTGKENCTLVLRIAPGCYLTCYYRLHKRCVFFTKS